MIERIWNVLLYLDKYFEVYLIGGGLIFFIIVAFALFVILPISIMMMTRPRPNGWY